MSFSLFFTPFPRCSLLHRFENGLAVADGLPDFLLFRLFLFEEYHFLHHQRSRPHSLLLVFLRFAPQSSKKRPFPARSNNNPGYSALGSTAPMSGKRTRAPSPLCSATRERTPADTRRTPASTRKYPRFLECTFCFRESSHAAERTKSTPRLSQCSISYCFFASSPDIPSFSCMSPLSLSPTRSGLRSSRAKFPSTKLAFTASCSAWNRS